MKDLSKEELLTALYDFYEAMDAANYNVFPKRNKQAYQQIRKLIEVVNFGELYLCPHCEKRIPVVTKKDKPKVSREFVEKWVEVFASEPKDLYFTTYANLVKMLREAGVKVEKYTRKLPKK